jgi:hypothetical protein
VLNLLCVLIATQLAVGSSPPSALGANGGYVLEADAVSIPEFPVDAIDPAESSWFEDYWELPSTQLTTIYMPRMNHQGFGMTSLDLRHTWLLGYDDHPPLNITPGIGTHFWTGPQALDLPSQVYDVYMDLQWQPWQSEKSSLMIGAMPGLFGDLERIDDQSFQWSGWLVGSRKLGTKWTALGGVAYLRQLQSNWLPIGGLVWAPNETNRAELVFPRPRLSRRIYSSDRWTSWSYVGGQFGGGAWSVQDSPEMNVLVGYSDLRLVGGFEAFSRAGREWRAEFGYVFARELRVDSVLLERPSDTLITQFTFAF